MARQYDKGQFDLMTKEDYVKIVCDQLEILPQEMVIHRLTGDGKKEDLVGPMWSLKKWEVLNAIDDELKRRDSWQGKYFNRKRGDRYDDENTHNPFKVFNRQY